MVVACVGLRLETDSFLAIMTRVLPIGGQRARVIDEPTRYHWSSGSCRVSLIICPGCRVWAVENQHFSTSLLTRRVHTFHSTGCGVSNPSAPMLNFAASRPGYSGNIQRHSGNIRHHSGNIRCHSGNIRGTFCEQACQTVSKLINWRNVAKSGALPVKDVNSKLMWNNMNLTSDKPNFCAKMFVTVQVHIVLFRHPGPCCRVG